MAGSVLQNVSFSFHFQAGEFIISQRKRSRGRKTQRLLPGPLVFETINHSEGAQYV